MSSTRAKRTVTLFSLIVDEYRPEVLSQKQKKEKEKEHHQHHQHHPIRTVSQQQTLTNSLATFEHIHSLFARILQKSGASDVYCWEFPTSKVKNVLPADLAWHRLERRLNRQPVEDENGDDNPNSDVSDPLNNEDTEEGEEPQIPPHPHFPPPKPPSEQQTNHDHSDNSTNNKRNNSAQQLLPPMPLNPPPKPNQYTIERHVTIGQKRMASLLQRSQSQAQVVMTNNADSSDSQSNATRMEWMRKRRESIQVKRRKRLDSEAVHVVTCGSDMLVQVGNISASCSSLPTSNRKLLPPSTTATTSAKQTKKSDKRAITRRKSDSILISNKITESSSSTTTTTEEKKTKRGSIRRSQSQDGLIVEHADWDDEFVSRLLCHML